MVQCPRCGFSLERVEAYFGVMPRLQPGISDLAALLRPRDYARLNAATDQVCERFPQLHWSIVTTRLRADQPLGAYAFWILNRGGVCRDLARGAKSRDFLLTVDAENGRANLMIGYGLEPFVGVEHLQTMVDAGGAAFAEEKWVEGMVAIVDKAAEVLADIWQRLGQTYGLDMDAVREAEDEELAAKKSVEGAY